MLLVINSQKKLEILMLFNILLISQINSKIFEEITKGTNKINSLKRSGTNLQREIEYKDSEKDQISQSETIKNIKYFFDFDNLIKKEETRNFFDKKIEEINKRKNLELYVFLFEDLKTESLRNKINFQKIQKLENKIKKEINLNKNFTNLGQIGQIGQNPQKKIFHKISFHHNKEAKEIHNSLSQSQENLNRKNSTHLKSLKNNNNKIKIKPKILNMNSFLAENIHNNNTTKEKIEPLNRNNTNLLKEFLLKNNLMKHEKSLVLLISKNENFLGIFLRNNSHLNFSYKDEKIIAKEFLKNILIGRTEYGLDKLIDDIDEKLLNKFSLNLLHLFALGFSFFFITIFLWFYYKDIINISIRKNKKSYEENLEVIKFITKKSLKKETRPSYGDSEENTCLICLEEIATRNNACNNNENIYAKNKQKIFEGKFDDNNIENESTFISNNFSFSDSGNNKIIGNDDNNIEIFSSHFEINGNNYFKNIIINNYNGRNLFEKKIEPKIQFRNQYNLLSSCTGPNSISNDKFKNKEALNKKEENNSDNNTQNNLLTSLPPNFQEDPYKKKEKEIINSNGNKNKNTKNNKNLNLSTSQEISISFFNEKNQSEKNQSNSKSSLNSCSNPSATEKNKSEKSEENFEAILDCNHIFHSKCIAMWMMRGDYCPICRSKIEIGAKRIKEKKQNLSNSYNSFAVRYYQNNISYEEQNNDSIIIS